MTKRSAKRGKAKAARKVKAKAPAHKRGSIIFGKGTEPRSKPKGRRPSKPAKASARATDLETLSRQHRIEILTRQQPTRLTSEIIVGKRHRTTFGDLDAFAARIDDTGALLHPIVITPDNKLIAGERRLKAWARTKLSDHGKLPIPVRVVDIASLIKGEWSENEDRLQFSPEEAVRIKKEMDAMLKPAAKARQAKGLRRGAAKAEAEAAPAGGRKRTADTVAAYTGKSRRTVEKAEKLVDAAEAEPDKYGKLVDDMNRTGRVDGPFKRLQNMKASSEIRKEPPPLPGNGPYRAGVFDFPWAAEPDADEAPEDRGYYPYQTMTTPQLVDYCKEHVGPILHGDGFVGAFWIPNFHLVNGHHLPILQALDLAPSTLLTGRKNTLGRGKVARGTTEHVVIARRGKTVIDTFPRTDFEFIVDRKHHSRKPHAFFDLFEKHVPAPRYFSLFETVDRGPNWDVHGDKVATPTAPVEATAEEPAVDAPMTFHPISDRELLQALEKIEAGEKFFMFAELRKRLAPLAGGKKKLRLTKLGKATLKAMREDAAEAKAPTQIDIEEAIAANARGVAMTPVEEHAATEGTAP